MKESVGKTLKEIRESKQLSIEDVSERTRIPKKILFDIEEDRLLDIGTPFYTRGFVKSYAQFLGAMSEKAVSEFLKVSAKKGEGALVLQGERLPGDWFLKYRKKIGLGIVGILAGWFLFFSLVNVRHFIKNFCSKDKAALTEKAEKKVTAPEPKKLDVRSPAVTKIVKRPDTKVEGVELKIEAKSNTWIQVEGDKRLLFKGILRKGTKDTWQAKNEIKLSLGDAGGVRLNVNGKDLGHIGKKGEIKKDIVITREGIK